MVKIFYLSILFSMMLFLGISCVSYAGSSDKNAAFEYRDIYLPDYNLQDSKKLNLDHLDEEWGIWGHNLSNVIPEEASEEVYAVSGGKTVDSQFCFSSDELFDYITDFIRNKYIFSDSIRFAILPNDNAVVCLCSRCVKLGNTNGNASPAVHNLIDRLAKKFPEHMFFTSQYSTTKEPPAKKMAPNTGVIVSAMEYPLYPGDSPKELSFLSSLEQWKEKTDRIYIWDYIMNYDDYFTPYPVFSAMQHRLKLYRDAGVTGVFLNGSGNDYSSFARLRKTVLADLMVNPDLDWESLLRKYAAELYPVAGSDIADFMVLQEKKLAESGKPLPLYEGMDKAIGIYLPEKDFVNFYNKIVQHKKNATGWEQEQLELMTDAMAYTMLELKRLNNDLENTEKLKERLGRLKSHGIEAYNEGLWNVERYLSQYEFMEQQAANSRGSNLLKGVRLRPLTPLDEDYPDITLLTDGQLGIPSNYHNGNLISSADPELRIAIPRQPGMTRLKVWMVSNPAFKIGLPEEVRVTVGGVSSPAQVPPEVKEGDGHSFLEFNVAGDGEIVLSLKKNPDIKTMALDEIEAF